MDGEGKIRNGAGRLSVKRRPAPFAVERIVTFDSEFEMSATNELSLRGLLRPDVSRRFRRRSSGRHNP